jgi:predicted CXXCH cytochrome family protein
MTADRFVISWRLLTAIVVLIACGVCFGKDSCFDCHRVMEGTSRKFTNDIHFAKSISCANCHGGNPMATEQNVAMNATNGFKLRVQRQGVPQFCGGCHADAGVMSKYETQPKVDQLAKYQNGVHGKLLAGGRKRSAECVDCHGVHTTRAVSDPISTASPSRISQTCGKCHEGTLQAFAATKHGKLFGTPRWPGCTVCHSAHDTEPATAAMLSGSKSICIPCHVQGTEPAKLAEEMVRFLAGLEASGSKEALTRARVAVHTLNLDAMKKAAETVPPEAGNN